ncbi:hypothetical protein RDABS01_038567 [Bienertia sinuspersici]
MNDSQVTNLPDHTLPQDILVHILSLLPAKSIGRFRCVSKPWKSLLSHPHFIKTHLNRTKQLLGEDEASLIFVSNDSGLLYSTQLKYTHHMFDEITTFATKLCFDNHRFRSYHVFNMVSCDGLVLLNDEENKFLLINPTTREFKELPTSPYALDRHLSNTISGLGYDSVNDDYKVVTSEMFVNVYSVRNGTWERADSSPYDHDVGYRFSPGTFVNGCIHWLGVRLSDASSVIAALDLGEGKFGEVSIPSWVVGDREFAFNHLVELGGFLCWYPASLLATGNTTDVYMMKEYGVMDSWTKFTISHSEPISLRPLCLLGKKQLVLVENEGCIGEKLVMCNLSGGSSKDIAVHGIADDFSVGGSFMESLVSPHCTTEAVTEC